MSAPVAVVTGAARGIGAAEARDLAGRGYALVVNDVDAAGLAAADLGTGPVVRVPGDVGASGTAAELVGAALERFGRVDAVVSNAGVLRDRMTFSMSDDEWDEIVRINLRGTFLLVREAGAAWRARFKQTGEPTGGRPVTTSSRAALLANPGQANYAAAKAGVATLTQIAARELRRYGVTCNAVAPRAATRLMTGAFGEIDPEQETRWAPEHVAAFVGFLCSPAAHDVTGQVFVVHGGEVALARPWQVGDPVTVHGATDTALRDLLDGAFGDDPPGIPDFRIGEDYPGGAR
ncbi:3-oxoacyl-[acyl-carrier protein] reductase [Pseudonocardia sp. Ae168_Ps1]|uniref:SDR family oxidoreductase n=1 Tax=unclassified Pseudonocardia TaxID=2619320 RepID=UPI00094B131C|nr:MULTISPECIES: SDR family oxidoreductase [unclassified Pseudonocardia]OLL72002.1 3-oxoacyl-[acyl-carrier protein] reductase [Pseudonocardia sp. Ae150A_Ps1]OLL77969.1 3-oxoacyl-[acyl-carrier protein] reductase [Pseudonocardia sp. Ae168_Ps1]OLL87908.1 3-oxoacyl-[acyl-carrier protein] reductase [Pseudonocardia sp. Ae263_Ps1]OLL92067.1 3-oxoacyl-[acyl-carrier protein] reductase [Pseudonocardia sp. Ae356_Ps1]